MKFRLSWFKPLLFLFLGCNISFMIIAVCVVPFFFYTESTGQSQGLSITNVVLTSDIDTTAAPMNRQSIFPQENSRIYCVVTTRGTFGLPIGGVMGLNWYYEDEQIAGHYVNIVPMSPVVTFIQPPDGQKFRSGRYRVEIFLDLQSETKTIEFEVR